MSDLSSIINKRAFLSEQGTTVYRAVHTTETSKMFSLDIAGCVGILSVYHDFSPHDELTLAKECAQAAGLESIYIKRRPPTASHVANTKRDYLSPKKPIFGADIPEVIALENGVPYVIRPASDLSTGLFCDARAARNWVRGCRASSVLNTFAYTCGFGLNAKLGGASTVKNVDMSHKVLAWGKENYSLSGVQSPDFDFLYGDVFEWLKRLEKRGDTFDLTVLDPPSFARAKAGTWRSDSDYHRLVAQAARVTKQGGRILALLNHAGVSASAFEKALESGLMQVSRKNRCLGSIQTEKDFPESSLKVLVWEV